MTKNKHLFFVILLITAIFLCLLVLKGKEGNPIYFQKEHVTIVGGPFESTNSTSRYSLTEAIVENHTFFFTEDQARFSASDIVQYNNKYFSVFTPGTSFFAVPFYALGKEIGLPQLITYLSTTLFAIINIFLVARLSHKLGSTALQGIVAGFIFLFATNALAYSLTMTQHHLTVTIVLLALLNAFQKRTFLNDIFFGILVGIGILSDIPDLFFLLPLSMYVFSQHFSLEETTKGLKVNVNLVFIGLLIGFLPLLFLFGWYNHQLTNSYTTIAQLIGRASVTSAVKPEIKKIPAKEKSSELRLVWTPFNPRQQYEGAYILLFSNERGLLYYSPVVLIGLFGLFLSYKSSKTRRITILMVSVIGVNIILYTMFFDPWGGWSFGPRYLIPTTALLCAGIGVAINKFRRNIVFSALFALLFFYSLYISTAGAMTTTMIPPKQESESLITPIPYTYDYNFQFIEKGQLGSLFYNIYFKNFIAGKYYYYSYLAFVAVIILAIYILSIRNVKKE